MTRKATGRPNGRPRGLVPLRQHPFAIVLAVADAMHFEWGITHQKALTLASAIFFYKSAEPILPEDLPAKLRRVFDEHRGDIAMAFNLPASGNPLTRNPKECLQSVDTLQKMARRYKSGADLAYRTDLAALVKLVMFQQGGEDMRRQMIEVILRRLDSPDPQINRLAEMALAPAGEG
jgi:hypothetical protein